MPRRCRCCGLLGPLIAAALLALPLAGHSQQELIPGDLGKRLLVGYNGSVAWRTWDEPIQDPGPQAAGSVGINHRHNLALEYLTGRQFGLGLELEYSALGQAMELIYGTPDGARTVERFGRIHTVGASLTLNWYAAGDLPGPVGPVSRWGLGLFRSRVHNATDFEQYEGYRRPSGTSEPDIWATYSNLGLTYALGNRFILFDRLGVMPMVQTRFLLPMGFRWDEAAPSGPGSNQPELSGDGPVLGNNITKRTIGAFALTLSLEVNYLIGF
jgi:hypothetical protein